jgi:peptide/nickel transport system substrate-binding protein
VEEKRGWSQLKHIKLDRKRLARRVKKAEGATQRHAHRFIVRRIDNIRLVTREITIWLLVVGVIIAAIGLQLIWGRSGFMRSSPAAGGTYVEGVVGEVDTMNPLFVSTPAEASVARLVFSSLYNYDETGSIRQDLARSLSSDQSGRVYTIVIRDDAQWHDGTALTAKDIVFTINLIKNPATRSPLRINWLDVSVTATNAKTVQFTLPATYAAFPHALTFPIMPEHLLKNIAPGSLRESAFSRSPVGSGPFSFRLLQQADNVSKHKVIHLLANSAFYGGSPKLGRFELHAYPTEDAIIRAVQAGELSGASGIPGTSLGLIDHSQYTLTPQALYSGVYLLFNTNNPILKDAKVRKALQVGTDMATLRKAVGGGVLPLDSPVIEGQLTGGDFPHLAPSDPAKARALLDEAGWVMSGSTRVKEGKTLEFTITTTKSTEYDRSVDVITKEWQKLGVKVNKKVVDVSGVSSTFVQDVLRARNFDMLLYELSIGADPDVYAYWHSSQVGQSGYNFSNYVSKVADASLASARLRLEPELRSAKYKQFVRQWQEDAPALGLYQPVLQYVANPGVSAVRPGTILVNEADRYANVQYWTVSDRLLYQTP